MADRAQLYKYKGNRCTGCGLSVEEMVARYGTFDRMFELHHVTPDSKHPTYDKLMKRTLSSEQIEEVDKCTLLCKQCHATIHAQAITAEFVLSVQVDQRTVTQRFAGWIKADKFNKSLTFVTNERLLLQLCKVTVGKRDPVDLCVIEIEREDNLLDWLRNISKYKSVEIRDFVGQKMLMQIEHIDGRRAKISQAIGFPVTAIDFSEEGGGTYSLWLRNGVVLTKDGQAITSGTISYTCDLL